MPNAEDQGTFPLRMTTALEDDSKKVGRVGSVTVIINGSDLLMANWNLHKRLLMMPRGPIHHDNANITVSLSCALW